jgi:hypothetical protein
MLLVVLFDDKLQPCLKPLAITKLAMNHDKDDAQQARQKPGYELCGRSNPDQRTKLMVTRVNASCCDKLCCHELD